MKEQFHLIAFLHILAALAVASCGGKATTGNGGSSGEGGAGGGAGVGGSSGSGGALGAGGTSGAGGGSGGGGSGGTGTGGSSGAPMDSGRPRPDSSECEMFPDSGAAAECVLCSDDNWHCGSEIFRQCPAGAMKGAPCTTPGMGSLCLRCWSDGGADELMCSSGAKRPAWGELSNYACTP